MDDPLARRWRFYDRSRNTIGRWTRRGLPRRRAGLAAAVLPAASCRAGRQRRAKTNRGAPERGGAQAGGAGNNRAAAAPGRIARSAGAFALRAQRAAALRAAGARHGRSVAGGPVRGGPGRPGAPPADAGAGPRAVRGVGLARSHARQSTTLLAVTYHDPAGAAADERPARRRADRRPRDRLRYAGRTDRAAAVAAGLRRPSAGRTAQAGATRAAPGLGSGAERCGRGLRQPGGPACLPVLAQRG